MKECTRGAAAIQILMAVLVGVIVTHSNLMAASIASQLKPTEAVDGRIRKNGFEFEIRSRMTSGGQVEFRIVIRESGQTFTESAPTVALSRVVEGVTPDGGWEQSISDRRPLTAERVAGSAICLFVVDQELLREPEMAFSFTNPTVSIINGAPVRMPSAVIFYARLGDFAPH